MRKKFFFLTALVWTAAAVLGLTSAALAQVKLVRHMAPEAVPLYEEAARLFTEKTGIEVELIAAPGAQLAKWEQVITMIAGGISPDIVDAISMEFGQYAARGLIQSFDKFLERDPIDRSLVNTQLLDPLTWQGEQYVIPYGASGLTLVYNPGHFQEAGVAAPPSQWNDPGWAWDVFVDTARKLTRREADGRVSRFGLGGNLGGWIDLGYHFGADWVSPDLTRWTGSDDEMVEALIRYQDLPWRDHVSPQPGEDGSFANQRSSMTMMGTWSIPAYVQYPFDWSFIPWPEAPPNPPVGVIYPVGMTLLSTAPNEAEAWELVKFLATDPEANYLWATAAGAVPMVLADIPRWAFELEEQRSGVNAIVFGEQVRAHGAVARVRKLSTFGEMNEIATRVLDEIMQQNKPVRLAMEEIAEQMQALVSQAIP